MSKKIILIISLLFISIILFYIVFRNQIVWKILDYEHRNTRQLAQEKTPLPKLDSNIEKDLKAYLTKQGKNPIEYIISCFNNHDIIFLGEMHRVKHDVDLVNKVIPHLYRNGVYILGIEFARRNDQGKIDSLIFADTYNEKLAQQIIFNWSVLWGYQEYVDLFKSAWRLNKGLTNNARKFRILGLDAIEDWSYINSVEDRQNEAIWKMVLPEGDRDEVMASVIEDEIINKNQKALIYSGMYHAFTKYKLPVYDFEKNQLVKQLDRRMGNLIYKLIGDRAMTISLHRPWPSLDEKSYVYPLDGILDAFMRKYALEFLPVGFNVKGSPFGALPANSSSHKYGYDNFKLSDYCDGYIFQKSLSKYKGVTPIKDFVTDENLAQAIKEIKNPLSKRLLKTGVLSYFPKTYLNWSITREARIEYRFSRFE